MINKTLAIVFIGSFFQSILIAVEIRGWNILSDNIEIAEETIYHAKNYNINHLQLSHHLIHNLKEVSEKNKLKTIKHLTTLAHNEGIEKVFIWDHALYNKSYYPREFFNKKTDQLNLDNQDFWKWFKEDYKNKLEKIKMIDGIVLTFIETGMRIENQYSKLYPSSAQKFKKLIKELNSVVNLHFGMDLILRTFSYNDSEIENIVKVVNGISDNNIYIMIKESNHDFFVTHPPNNLVDIIDNNKRIIVEFDAAHEFSGQGIVASIFPDFHFNKAKHFSKYKNVIGYSIRTDRYGDTSIINKPAEINLFSISEGFLKDYSSSAQVIKTYISKTYGVENVEKLFRIFDESGDIILSSFYTLGLNTARHSKLNFDYRSIYTRHVSGRWLENPVIYIEHGVNKKYHYWKDIVNYLSPKKHKSGQGYYKTRSSPNDSISYMILNQLEIPQVINNGWLIPEELMNESYLEDILKEKKWSIKKTEELLSLLHDTKSHLDKKEYEKLERMFYRTLLTVKLRAAVAAVYYGDRIRPRTRNILNIIEENKSRAKKVIKNLENYNLSYPIGEYNWKKDYELAKIYINNK